MTAVPPLAVVMPVRNAAPYLEAAVRSILGQTASNFEFVIVDDASTDGSSEMLAALAARDARLRVVRSSGRLGLVGSSNAAVRASRAPLSTWPRVQAWRPGLTWWTPRRWEPGSLPRWRGRTVHPESIESHSASSGLLWRPGLQENTPNLPSASA